VGLLYIIVRWAVQSLKCDNINSPHAFLFRNHRTKGAGRANFIFMESKKVIVLKRKNLLFALFSFLTAFLIVFVVDFVGGTLQYIPVTSAEGRYQFDSRVSSIHYSTPFGCSIRTSGVQYTVGDLINGRENKVTEIKLYCTFESLKEDYIVIVVISFIMIMIRFIFIKVSLKLV